MGEFGSEYGKDYRQQEKKVREECLQNRGV